MSSEQDGSGGSAPRRSPGSMTMDPMIGLTVLGRYEVERRIGSGGMGSVYVGKQKTVGRNVALKILRSDLTTNEHVRERFRREAEIIGKLRHPNTIQLIDYGETDDGMAVMVMELLVGRPLNDRLRESGPMPLVDALTVGIEVASSLAEAHLLGLVHRDLKPANIFLVEVAGQTHAKVLDFGIARILDEEATRLTSTGQVFGTPRYMSPEQALSTGEVDARSDIYSLGLIIYECIVGQPPFVAQTSIQYLSAHSTQTPPKLRDHYADAPEALEQLVDACLAKDPEDRPQTADAVVDALIAIRRSLEGGQTGPITIPRGNTRPGLVVDASSGSGLTNTAVSPPRTSGQTATALVGGAKTTVDDTLVRPQTLSGATSQPTSPPRSPYMLYGGVAAVVLAVAIAGAAIWSRMREPGVVSQPLDASTAIVQSARDAAVIVASAPDAGAVEAARDAAVVAIAEIAPDAGVVEAARDAGVRDTPKGTTKRKDATGTVGSPGKDGVVTGPAKMEIDVGSGDATLFEVAKACKESVLRGDARLTVKGCPSGCAIVVDEEKCAGLTPAENVAIGPGYREIVVVCGGKKRLQTQTKLEAGQETVLSCR